jgi:hypothetical protein
MTAACPSVREFPRPSSRRTYAGPMTDTHANYLHDLGQLVRKAGEEAKQEAASATPEDKWLEDAERFAL